MLSERERRILALIEAHIRREGPALAHFLTHGAHPTLLRRPDPASAPALVLTMATVCAGIVLATLGAVLPAAPLLVTGLVVAMIGPLPTWLLATSTRGLPRRRRAW